MGGTSNTLVLVDTSISGGTTWGTSVAWIGLFTEDFPHYYFSHCVDSDTPAFPFPDQQLENPHS